MKQAVRGSKTGRPISRLLDVLGRRWALRIVYELSNGEALTFRALQSRCGKIVPSVLNSRLQELREADLIAHDGSGYRLTDQAETLTPLLFKLNDWAEAWDCR